MRDVELAIIGGGVAGLTAGLYAAWSRLDAVLIERMGTGGQIINADSVENFPGFPGGIKGYELAPLIAQQAMDAGLPVVFDEALRLRATDGALLVESESETYRARAVIVTAGSTLARLGVPGEEQFEGRGVSYCAVCDGDFFRDQAVAVVGGGDSAMDEALYLAGIASEITVVHRRDELRAARTLVERARAEPKIRFRWHTTVASIDGGETVESIRLRAAGGDETLPVAGVFIYVGLRPNTSLLGGIVELDAAGHVPVDMWMRTAVPGLLAAGDIRQQSARQLVSAAGDGATATLAAARFLRHGEWRDG